MAATLTADAHLQGVRPLPASVPIQTIPRADLLCALAQDEPDFADAFARWAKIVTADHDACVPFGAAVHPHERTYWTATWWRPSRCDCDVGDCDHTPEADHHMATTAHAAMSIFPPDISDRLLRRLQVTPTSPPNVDATQQRTPDQRMPATATCAT